MRATKKKALITAGVVSLVTAGAFQAAPAFADYQPGPNDVVGVGGDTPQYDADFVADGDYSGDAGYNTGGGAYKLVYFNAVPDANGRQAYTNSATTAGGASVALNATDVLRAGKVPVQRNQSSGNSITALLADTGSTETINYVASASLPTSTQQSQAASNGWGYLHVTKISTETLEFVGKTGGHAPAGLSIADLLNIYTGTYTTWNQIPGNSGGSTNTIKLDLPQASSTLTKNFLADLKTANGGTAPTASSTTVHSGVVEQNDPTVISADADVIAPFSSARLALWAGGYFHDPSTLYPGSPSSLTSGVTALTGTPGSGTAYTSLITHYIIFRQSDASSSTAWQPGTTKNWVNALFSATSGTPYFKSGAGQVDIAAAGATPAYSDLGNVSG